MSPYHGDAQGEILARKYDRATARLEEILKETAYFSFSGFDEYSIEDQLTAIGYERVRMPSVGSIYWRRDGEKIQILLDENPSALEMNRRGFFFCESTDEDYDSLQDKLLNHYHQNTMKRRTVQEKGFRYACMGFVPLATSLGILMGADDFDTLNTLVIIALNASGLGTFGYGNYLLKKGEKMNKNRHELENVSITIGHKALYAALKPTAEHARLMENVPQVRIDIEEGEKQYIEVVARLNETLEE